MHPAVKDHLRDTMNAIRDPEGIRQACESLRSATTRAELAEVLYREVSGYSLFDLQAMRGRVEQDLRSVPVGYRRRLYPRMMEMIFETHHTLISSVRRGDLDIQNEPLATEFQEYCTMVEKTCAAQEEEKRPLDLLYYLLAAFNMFVLGLPGHPVGTPFPGGLEVEVRGGEYICPIREKADDVENALCPYCPAKQSDD